MPLKEDTSGLWSVEAINAIEDTCLAGPVWADNGQNLLLSHAEVYGIEGPHAAKAKVELMDLQDNFILLPLIIHALIPEGLTLLGSRPGGFPYLLQDLLRFQLKRFFL